MKSRITRWRRRLCYLILRDPDRCLVSTALANNHAFTDCNKDVNKRQEFNALLREMEGISKC